MTLFPVHVFRSPGDYEHRGKTYRLTSAVDQAHLDTLLAEGWHMTWDDAFAAAGDAAIKPAKKKANWRELGKQRAKDRKLFKEQRRARLAAQAAPTPLSVQSDAAEAPSDNAPPTRAELEQQATLLGIRFGVRTTDERLLDRINEAMKGA